MSKKTNKKMNKKQHADPWVEILENQLLKDAKGIVAVIGRYLTSGATKEQLELKICAYLRNNVPQIRHYRNTMTTIDHPHPY